MYGYERWTIKKAERWRIDAFELWCWRRLLRVPWTARSSNQSILKEISPECSLEGLTLKLKLQYFGHLIWKLTHWKRPWCWERLRAGGEGDDRRWDGWMASPTQWRWVWVNSRSWWWTGRPGVLWSMESWRVRHDWATELNWIRKPQNIYCCCHCLVAQSCQTLLQSYGLGFSRQEYWSELPFAFSRRSSWPRDRTHVSCLHLHPCWQIFYHWATREVPQYIYQN